MLYSHLQHHNDTINKQTHAERRRKEDAERTSLTIFLPLALLQGFERVDQGLHVRGSWRSKITAIF